MTLPQYALTSNEDYTEYSFTSIGTRGRILKIIQFQSTHYKTIFNLAFGDAKTIENELDDSVISNNGDTTKVLTSVAISIYRFTEKYPYRIVYFSGNDVARNRLYRMAISKYFYIIRIHFEVYGQIGLNIEMFKENTEYSAYFVKRKN